MKAEIISVGDELLAGTTVNTNTAFLAREMSMLGYDVHRQCVIGDKARDIIEAVKAAVRRSHVIVFTGGLGPTEDDLTKETVAKALGMKLVKNDEAEESMRAFFAQRGLEMTANNLKQAYVLEGAEVLKNSNGTAPGIFVRSKNQAIILLPGPPFELEPMFLNEVKPRLGQMADVKAAHRSLHVFGIGESALEEKCRDLLYGDNPSAALYAKPWEVHINISARARSDEGAQNLLEQKLQLFRDRLGEFIFSEDDREMNEVVVDMLVKSSSKISVAESCTGGLMASRITAVPGASKVFDLGTAAYSNRAKQSSLGIDPSLLRKYTAVSSATAAEMANGALSRGHADVAVGITGIAGPTNEGYIDKPVGLVYISVADKSKVLVKKFMFGNMRSRESIRELCVQNAFDMVRRVLGGLPIEDAREFSVKDIADVDKKGRPRKKSSLAVEKGIIGVLCAGVMFSGMFMGVRALRNRLDESVYSELQSTYTSGQSADALTSLFEQNPDTVGWLSSNGGAVDCVVVRDKGDGFYSNHDFSGSKNTLGCPYILEPQSAPAAADPIEGGTSVEQQNTIVYGRSTDSGQVFGPLRELASESSKALASVDYLFNFTTASGSADYKIASVFIANENPEFGKLDDFYKSVSFPDAAAFENFVVDLKIRSVMTINTSIVSSDKFLTLVTDLDGWQGEKLVVVARRVREGETVTMNDQMFQKNMVALYPEQYYKLASLSPNINEVIERDKWRNWLLANEKSAGETDPAATVASGGQVKPVGTPKPQPSDVVDGQNVIRVTMNGSVMTDTPLRIISKMVAAEMDDSYSPEAIKAQAVAASSWLRYSYNLTEAPLVQGASASDNITALVSS
ncbi:MAG: competence/damage-inducible protein A, partial [Oscillospiraceae bacterium]